MSSCLVHVCMCVGLANIPFCRKTFKNCHLQYLCELGFMQCSYTHTSITLAEGVH